MVAMYKFMVKQTADSIDARMAGAVQLYHRKGFIGTVTFNNMDTFYQV